MVLVSRDSLKERSRHRRDAKVPRDKATCCQLVLLDRLTLRDGIADVARAGDLGLVSVYDYSSLQYSSVR